VGGVDSNGYFELNGRVVISRGIFILTFIDPQPIISAATQLNGRWEELRSSKASPGEKMDKKGET
jgi:hypothetical protein